MSELSYFEQETLEALVGDYCRGDRSGVKRELEALRESNPKLHNAIVREIKRTQEETRANEARIEREQAEAAAAKATAAENERQRVIARDAAINGSRDPLIELLAKLIGTMSTVRPDSFAVLRDALGRVVEAREQ